MPGTYLDEYARFKAELGQHYTVATQRSDEIYKRRIMRGYGLLKAVRQLEGLISHDSNNHALFANILYEARQSLIHSNTSSLANAVGSLKQQMSYSQKTDRNYATAGAFVSGLFGCAGVTAAGMGIGFIAGFIPLAFTPIGPLALGVGLAIVGVITAIAAFSALSEKINFINEKQLADIDEFINDNDGPDSSAANDYYAQAEDNSYPSAPPSYLMTVTPPELRTVYNPH